MPGKNRYITEEYLENRLDERFAEQADLIQRGFFDMQGQIDGLREVVGLLVKKIDDGFGKLDQYTGNLKRLDEAEAMNQAAHQRFDGRLTSLEQKPART